MANGAGQALADAVDTLKMGAHMGKRPPRKPRPKVRAKPKRVTSKQVLAEPEERRLEVIAGAVAEKAAPSFEHAAFQIQLGGLIGLQFGSSGRGGPGGWWIASECDIELGQDDLVRPDVAGWRRARVPEPPSGRPLRLAPDWVCELVSPPSTRRDKVEKVRPYHRAGVGHYWMVDPEELILTVMKYEPVGFLVQLVAAGDEPIGAW